MSTLEQAQEWEYAAAMVAAERDRRESGTGMVCLPVAGEWVDDDEDA